MNDGNILLELTKVKAKFKFQGIKLETNMSMKLDNINYNTWVKIRRLIKKLNIGVIMRSEGDLDTINLLDHPKQYNLTLKKAFKILEKNNKTIACSLTFMPIKKEWMNR